MGVNTTDVTRNLQAQPISEPEAAGDSGWSQEELEALREHVFSRSLEDLRANLGPSQGQTEARQEILAWVDGLGDPDNPFSFENCCLAVGLDIQGMREEIHGIVQANIRARAEVA